jgi:hypothetical protein
VAEALVEHRDLIHPRAEIRSRIRVNRTTAATMIHLLTVVLADLSEAEARGDIQRYMEK